MKLLALYGSPRENGNSDILLNYALQGVQESQVQYEKIFIRDLEIKYCRGCRACDTLGLCIISDQMKKIYEKLETFDRVIVSSPIYFYGVSAQLKTLIDRSQCFWARKYLLKKTIEGKRLGAFIAVGASKGEKLFEGARLTIKYFFDAYDFEYFDELFVRSIDKKGEILLKQEELEKATQLGKKLCLK